MRNSKTKLFGLLAGQFSLLVLGIFLTGNCAHADSSAGYLLWSKSSGRANLWTLNSNNDYVSSREYSNSSDWTAMDFHIDQDDYHRYLLWSKKNGEAELWTLDDDNDYQDDRYYDLGKSGWQATAYYCDENESDRYLLWSNDDGDAELWRLDSNNSYIDRETFTYDGAFDQRTATDYYRSEDGSRAYLLWSDENNSWTALWILDDDNNYLTYDDYGRSDNWLATDYYRDNKSSNRYLLWSRTDGEASLWTLNSNNDYVKTKDYDAQNNWVARSYQKGTASDSFGSIEITRPQSDETWEKGRSYSVNFNYDSSIRTARIYLSRDYDNYLLSLSGEFSLSQSSSWASRSVTIPKSIENDNYYRILIRGFNASGDTVAETYSDGYVRVQGTYSTYIDVINPDGGEVWETGRSYTIRCDADETTYVRIKLYKSNYYYRTISDNLNVCGPYNENSLVWTIPENIETGSNYKIRIENVSDSSIYDQSENYFSITNGSYYPSYIADGALIRNPNASGDARFDVYIVKLINGKRFKRLILSPAVFLSYGHLDPSQVILVNQETMNSYTTSDLVRAEYDSRVYKLYPSGDTGMKRWIKTTWAFSRLGYDSDAIYTINAFDRDSYWEGSPIE